MCKVTFSPLSETLCYQLLYGDLINCVPHYKNRCFFKIISNNIHKLEIHILGGGGGGGGMSDNGGDHIRKDGGRPGEYIT